MKTKLKAPFPWFGGKSRCAHIVWDRFGNAPNFVDPFCGSLAVPLLRPHLPRTETFNDRDCYLANFWRAVSHDAEQVAHFANWPVNEADLHARHKWLVDQAQFRDRMMSDPDYFEPKIAGWWVWGISQWIGSGWCSRPEWMGRTLPGRAPRGVHSDKWRRRNLTHSSNWHKRVSVGRGGRGVHRKSPTFKRALGCGVLRTEHRPPRQLPDVSGESGATGRGVNAGYVRNNLIDYMLALQERLRYARICCGDWRRILGPSPTTCIGVTAVLLDPPYSQEADRDSSIYNAEDLKVARDVAQWAREHGNNPKLRIALCGYEGEHKMPRNWTCFAWKANGGYGNQASGRGRENARRERIWFSPHCLQPQGVLL